MNVPTLRDENGVLVIEWPQPRPATFEITAEAFEQLVDAANVGRGNMSAPETPRYDHSLSCSDCGRSWDNERCGINHADDCPERCPDCESTWNGESHVEGCERIGTCSQMGPPWVLLADSHDEPHDWSAEWHRDHMRTVEHRFVEAAS